MGATGDISYNLRAARAQCEIITASGLSRPVTVVWYLHYYSPGLFEARVCARSHQVTVGVLTRWERVATRGECS